MENLGPNRRRKAQAGTARLGYAGLLVCLALGCASSRKPDNRATETETEGSGGGRPAGMAGTSGAGAGAGGTGTSGVGGIGGTGGFAGAQGWTGGAGGAPQCTDHATPEIYACVSGDAVNETGDRMASVELTGIVARLEEAATCDGAHLGNERARTQLYAVTNETTSIELRLGGTKPILVPGQTVSVSYDVLNRSPYPSEGTLVVRDEAGSVLYWLTQSSDGSVELELPPGVRVDVGRYGCATKTACGTFDWAGQAVVGDSDGELDLEYGERGDLRDYTAVVVSNSTFTPNDTCLDSTTYHTVALAFLPRGFFSVCYGLDEAACSGVESCRAVSAYFEPEAPPTFVTCVTDDSCRDDDAVKCAYRAGTDQVAAFTTSCVPPGWSAYDNNDCLRGGDDDAGVP